MVAASLINMHFPFSPCHPEAEESAAKRRTPNEGPVHLAGTIAAADESIGPSPAETRTSG